MSPTTTSLVRASTLTPRAASNTTTFAFARARRHDTAIATHDENKVDSRFDVRIAPSTVRLSLSVTNVGGKHVELNFASGQSYDFVVVDSVGREVWRWASGRMFTQAVRNKQLGKGETMNVAETWTGAKHAGHYTAIATLNSTNYPIEQRVEFVIQ